MAERAYPSTSLGWQTAQRCSPAGSEPNWGDGTGGGAESDCARTQMAASRQKPKKSSSRDGSGWLPGRGRRPERDTQYAFAFTPIRLRHFLAVGLARLYAFTL